MNILLILICGKFPDAYKLHLFSDFFLFIKYFYGNLIFTVV